MKFAYTLLIAGSLGQINALRVASEDKQTTEMESCGPDAKPHNPTECADWFKCEQKTFVNSGGFAETTHVCQYGQEGDVCDPL